MTLALGGGIGAALAAAITITVLVLQRNAARRDAVRAWAQAYAHQAEVTRLTAELVASEGRRVDEAGRHHDLAAELRAMEADLAACRDPAVVRARLLRLLSDPAPAPDGRPSAAGLPVPSPAEDRRRRS